MNHVIHELKTGYYIDMLHKLNTTAPILANTSGQLKNYRIIAKLSICVVIFKKNA